MPLTLGQRLYRLRQQRGIEQRQVAAAIGKTASYLSQLENDRKGNKLDHARGTLEALARFYGVIPEYLLAETPQEYLRAFVKSKHTDAQLSTVGRRVGAVLKELERWGDEYTEDAIADRLGVTTETLRGYVTDRLPLTHEFIKAVAELTGVSMDFYLPVTPSSEDDPALRRVLRAALDSGITSDELEFLIRAWSATKIKNRTKE